MNDTAKLVLGIVGGFALLLLLLLLAGGGMFGWGPMVYGLGNGHGQMIGGYGSWWVLIPMLFWVGLLALIGWAIARILPNGPGGITPRNSSENASPAWR